MRRRVELGHTRDVVEVVIEYDGETVEIASPEGAGAVAESWGMVRAIRDALDRLLAKEDPETDTDDGGAGGGP